MNTEWLKCPICDEPDTRVEKYGDEGLVYTCANLNCGSNGGDNFCAMKPKMNSYTELKTWEILVPHRMGSHDNYRYDKTLPKSKQVIPVSYHQIWDEKVRTISGGLTICKATKGQWVDLDGRLYREIMIPVKIACSEDQIKEIT